jgi:membrane associated rhomboid family serine protease
VTKWVRTLIIANVIMFFVEIAGPRGLVNSLVLVPRNALYAPWTMITYMFLHDPNNIMHILFNMLGLYWFGVSVEERLGSARFLTLYFISGLAGAILSIFLSPNAAVIGASGAIFGVMLAFARFWPDAQILFFFILPLQARFAVMIMAAMQLYSGLRGVGGGVANFCHLGGFAGAWLYLVYLERRAGVKKFRKQTVAPVAKENLSNWKRVDPKKIHEVNRDEVNRILDKISAKGLTSLTPQEQLFLSNFVPPDDRVPPVS